MNDLQGSRKRWHAGSLTGGLQWHYLKKSSEKQVMKQLFEPEKNVLTEGHLCILGSRDGGLIEVCLEVV